MRKTRLGHRVVTTMVMTAVLALPAAGAARAGDPLREREPARSPAEEEARRATHERLRAEVLDQMRAMRTWKLTEELKLDQAAAATVFPILAQFDDRAREIGRERREIARQVREQTRTEPADNAKLIVLVDRLQANQARRNALDEERFKALKPALTPLQQARLLLLLPRLEDDFRRRIREAMQAQQRREDGPGGPGGPPPLPRRDRTKD